MKKLLRFADCFVLLGAIIGCLLRFWLRNAVSAGAHVQAMTHPAWLLLCLLSAAVVAFLSRFLPSFSGEMGHTLLRKLAHFSEFACLGLLMGTTLRFYGKPVFRATGLGLAAACVDETIQVFVPGRASSLIDVWIDTAGFATGLLILMLGYTFTRKSQRN